MRSEEETNPYDADFLLSLIRGYLRGDTGKPFYYVKDIDRIAFGSLLWPEKLIPAPEKCPSLKMQEFRTKIPLFLEILVYRGNITFLEENEVSRTYKVNRRDGNGQGNGRV